MLFFVPTAIWQLVNDGSDLRVLSHYLLNKSHTNLDVFAMLIAALGTLNVKDFGPASPVAALAPWYPLLAAGTAILFALGMVVLTVRVFAPVRATWQTHPVPASAGRVERLRAGALGLWHGLRADSAWRGNLLLWLVVVVPVALMVRHSNDLTVHYLMVLYPSAFIAAGVGVQAVVEWTQARRAATDLRGPLTRATPVIAAMVLALVVTLNSALWLAYPATLASGQFDAFVSYGYPLDEVQQADSALANLQRQQQAASIAISLPTDARLRQPFDYLLVSEHAGRTDFTNNCLCCLQRKPAHRCS